MKTKFLVLPFCAALMLASCEKERVSPAKKNPAQSGNSQVAVNRDPVTLLLPDELFGALPTITGMNPIQTNDSKPSANINGVRRAYQTSGGSNIIFSLADLGNAPTALNEFLIGRGIYMGTESEIAGMSVSLYSEYAADPSVLTNCQMLLSQSTNRGAVSFALASDGWLPLGLNLATAAPDQFTMAQGSSITAYSDAAHPSIAGWRIYDATTHTAMIILSVGERFGLLMEQTGVDGLNTLQTYVNSVNLNYLESKGF